MHPFSRRNRAMTRPLDTSLEAEEIQLEVFRQMTPEQRLAAGMALSQTCRKLMEEGVRIRHPEYDEWQVKMAVIRLILPGDLFLKAYPHAGTILP